MIVDPKAELEALAYQLFSWKRTQPGYTYGQAEIDAQAAITQMLTETPSATVLSHPLVEWVANRFIINWYAATAAVGPFLPA